ncbi:type VI secretion system Vgr family protein [Capnocytophaga sp. oral taxon 324]|jgi:phage-related baseplate assembly protein|uniref:type VI secretion system Vgr family protein n=1 Tax=Capnocytophaga sp. oral taxon 324 TaxID=712211 RepID=UPI0002A41771|nr:phage baseplate assembly protein V [Capnocytophaga sp. oral taxon 324]EKY18413.1 Rhs element Vgr protein [Capnocytophaga sp. oral taxon 324 str. F0483]
MQSTFSKLRPIFHSIHIDGKDKTSRFNSLLLKQSFNSCCDFELIETIATRKTLWQGESQELLKQVGKNVIIRLSFPRGQNTYQFSGFITEVVIDSDTAIQGGSENKIRIIGKGSPVVLDDAPSMNSFVDQDLKNIVEKVFKNKYFDLTCNPKFKEIIPYATQYKESRWGFLNRLSAIYNELLYFDGSKLVFGGVADEHSENLTIDEDITEFKVSSRTLPFKYTLYNYNAEDDEYSYSDTEEEIRPRNTYTKNVFQDPENLYQQRGMLPIEVPAHLSGDTIRLQQSKYQQSLGKMHSIEGKTHNSLVRLGGLIYVKFPSGFEKENMGEYRVISVEHCVDRDDYYNHFVAVPLGMEYTLYEPITVAYPEIAEVVANDDPKKQGRIQVRFFWQKTLGEQTPWLRVQTPDAGVLTDKSGNRGFQFIPEVGDQVMVSFEQGNPHRPYVSGSMYHGKNAKEVSNNVRSITTKSGSTIVFDDNDGKERITIKDKNGNIILLDTKAKSIEITAPENIVMKAKNITLEAEARIEAKAKENITATAEKELLFSANDEGVIQTKKGFTVKTDDDVIVKSQGGMNVSIERDLQIKSKGDALLKGSGTTKIEGSETKVSGKTASLESSSTKFELS